MNTKDARKRRVGRGWLWLLAIPAGFLCLVIKFFSTLALVEESPGYFLATQWLSSHAGVVELLGEPVKVAGTEAKHITKTLQGDTLRLRLALEGSREPGSAEVMVSEHDGHWVVERATIVSSRGQFGLLADGGLQPLYDPKSALASGP